MFMHRAPGRLITHTPCVQMPKRDKKTIDDDVDDFISVVCCAVFRVGF